MVRTQDSESCNGSSNLPGTFDTGISLKGAPTLSTSRDGRKRLMDYSPIAQSVEHQAVNFGTKLTGTWESQVQTLLGELLGVGTHLKTLLDI